MELFLPRGVGYGFLFLCKIHTALRDPFSPDLIDTGSFHQTSARRTVIDLDAIALCCLAAAGVVGWVRSLTGYSTLPPHTWARTADNKTRKEVEATMSMAFNMARSAPTNQRHDKIREATFHVPYELARLNKEAPRFRLEDLGPLAQGRLPWMSGPFGSLNKDGPPLNAKTETRAFLYFPNGSPKATAVFLAVNSELMYPFKAEMQCPTAENVLYTRKPAALLVAFAVVYDDWEQNRPSVTDRIVETSRLPVICNFQENVFGCIFYPVPKRAPNTRMGWTPLNVTDFDLKTSRI